MRCVDTTDLWYRDDGIKLKPEYGMLYVRSVLTGIKRICICIYYNASPHRYHNVF
jgi:hypothetical protein